MDASRCRRIAEAAVACGDKERALKFIKMAKRLDPSLCLDSVLKNPPATQNYTEENVELVRNIERNSDYYTLLGLRKNCSVEEIRKAYRKLSLKVHPDKNKAPGSEEAFKKVLKAFTCLSHGDSRSQYDQLCFVDELNHVRTRPRRRYTTRNYDYDPGETFRAYRTRQSRQEDPNVAGPTSLLLLIPLLLLFLLAYLPFSDPDYSLHKNQSYQMPKTTQDMEITFYVRPSPAFDDKFPLGSSARAILEGNVIKQYINFLFHSCRVELQKRRWNKKLPTPHCSELRDRGFVDRRIPI